MSLNDRYDRGGQGRLENLDRYLTELGNRFGNYWWDRTVVDRSTLTQGLYLLAAWAGLQHTALFHRPMMLIWVGVSLFGLMGIGQTRGTLVEQMQIELLGLPKQTFAFLRLFVLSIGLLSLATAAGQLLVSLQTGTAIPMEATSSLLTGLALTGLQVSEYIRRTNPSFPSSGLRRRA